MIVDYQFIRGKDSKILGIDYSKNPMFGIFKQFTSDGIIQLKGLKSYYGFKLGIWYYYDASGKLIKCIDQDAGYKFGTLDVINYCLKNKIPVNKQAAENMPDWPLVTIAKIRIRNGHPAWFIIYPDGTLDKRIYIDAKNGKVVETQETPGSLN